MKIQSCAITKITKIRKIIMIFIIQSSDEYKMITFLFHHAAIQDEFYSKYIIYIDLRDIYRHLNMNLVLFIVKSMSP